MIRGIVNSVKEGLIKLWNGVGLLGESFADREYMQHYGFTSRPLAGAEVIIVRQGNHFVAIASDDRRYRLHVAEGEVALYTDEGDKIHLKRDKTIEIVSGHKLVANVADEVDITTKTAKIQSSVSCTIDAPTVTVTASGACAVHAPAIILGEGATRSIVDERMLAAYNNHTHPQGGAPSPQLSASAHCTSVTRAL